MTAPHSDELCALLRKAASGTLTDAERLLLDEWYAALQLQNEPVFASEQEENLIRQRVKDRILASAGQLATLTPQRRPLRRLARWASAAAVLMLVMGGWLFSRHNTAHKDIPFATIQTGYGQIKQIMLEDGSKIWLNAGSTLRYPEQFGRHERIVELEGEAFFEVAQDATRPFAVHTRQLTTHVLGTAFTITAYKESSREVVSVESGKVQVDHQQQSLGIIMPNQCMEYRKDNGKATQYQANAATIASWKQGSLEFDSFQMQDIAARLGRWYGYAFHFQNDQLRYCHYTASFNQSIALKDLMKVMKAISLVEYKIDTVHKTVTIMGAGCNE